MVCVTGPILKLMKNEIAIVAKQLLTILQLVIVNLRTSLHTCYYLLRFRRTLSRPMGCHSSSQSLDIQESHLCLRLSKPSVPLLLLQVNLKTQIQYLIQDIKAALHQLITIHFTYFSDNRPESCDHGVIFCVLRKTVYSKVSTHLERK